MNVPIGLINNAYSGSYIQAWLSRETLLKRDDSRELVLATEQRFAVWGTGILTLPQVAWFETNDIGTREDWQRPSFDDAAWKPLNMPGAREKSALSDFDGLVWLRATTDIPALWNGKEGVLRLGAIDEMDTTFWNGEIVGANSAFLPGARTYKLPVKKMKSGKAVIAVRVLNTKGKGGFVGKDAPRLELAEDANQKIEISDWRIAARTPIKDLPPLPGDGRGDFNQPTVLHNGMLRPLAPFAIRGVAWYQGESNLYDSRYQALFTDLIRDWRTLWGAQQDGSEFGFYFVQLANNGPRQTQPVESGWAGLRAAQTQILKLVPRTNMALALDVGEMHNVHPRNKQDVGKRLASAALFTEYGQDVEYSGPLFYRAEKVVAKSEIRVLFSHATGIKTTDGNAPREWELQDDAGKWHNAQARLEGEILVVWSEEVLAPRAVGYAWKDNPDVNLINAADLPAAPFRAKVLP